MIDGYKTVKEVAEEWGLHPRTVQIMCSDGKIPRAAKLGREWAVPADAKKPQDKRVVSGQYRECRKKKSQE